MRAFQYFSTSKSTWKSIAPLICALASSCLPIPQIPDDRPEPSSVNGQVTTQSHEPIVLEDFDGPGSVVIYRPGKQDWQPISYRDCNQEQIQCFRDCWNVDPPWPRERGRQGHYSYCSEKCLKEYIICMDEQATRHAFTSFAVARAWLYRHRELAVGAVIVIGFSIFVVATDGAALVLSPKLAEYAPQLNYR